MAYNLMLMGLSKASNILAICCLSCLIKMMSKKRKKKKMMS